MKTTVRRIQTYEENFLFLWGDAQESKQREDPPLEKDIYATKPQYHKRSETRNRTFGFQKELVFEGWTTFF